MKGATKTVGLEKRNYCKPAAKYSLSLLSCLVVLFLAFGEVWAQAEWPHVVPSKDGTPISYEIYGVGEPSLVFVHGWSCDARYWRAQLPHFSKNHRVVVLDLAGHGHSGSTRSQYTMKSFGEDVQAVTEATDSRRIILIGHSMGGSVIAEAARLMPNRVIGLIGIDTLENIEYPMTREELDQMIAPLAKDFRTGSRQFVKPMILPSTDPQLREWILSDMSAAAPAVALALDLPVRLERVEPLSRRLPRDAPLAEDRRISAARAAGVLDGPCPARRPARWRGARARPGT